VETSLSPFIDRTSAAVELAEALSAYRDKHPLVLAVPCGGVPIGRVVADTLGGDLDVVLVRALVASSGSTTVQGFIDELGIVRLSDAAHRAGIDVGCVEDEASRQFGLLCDRRKLYSGGQAPLDPAGRIVIVVDDGIATGATLQAVLTSLRARRPTQLVCAVPIAAPESVAAIEALCDEMVCLAASQDAPTPGPHDQRFTPVDDGDVIALLSGAPAMSVRPAEIVARTVRIAAGSIDVLGDLDVPAGAEGLVIFVHGRSSGRSSPRSRFLARMLGQRHLATLLCDLGCDAGPDGQALPADTAALAGRVESVLAWARSDACVRGLPIGLFGAGTGAAAVLIAASKRPAVKAIVSRGGRLDFVGRTALARVTTPTLLIVGAADTDVLAVNRSAVASMHGKAKLSIVPEAGHLFGESGALEDVAVLASLWFRCHLTGSASASVRLPPY